MAPVKPPVKPPESLTHAVTRMRDQGFTDADIFAQVQKWHPDWDPTKITNRTGILGGGPGSQPKAPVPALQPFGVTKTIDEVNNDVQNIVDAHQQHFGHAPSAGLVFDVLKATPVLGPNPNYQALFGSVPRTQRDAQLRTLSSAQPDEQQSLDHTYVRPDGLVVQPTAPGLPNSDELHHLNKEFPTVQMGMIPAWWQNNLYHAMSVVTQSLPDTIPVKANGESWEQAYDRAKLAYGNEGAKAVLQGGPQPKNPIDVNQEVRTITAAQQQLNKWMGTKLPVTGYMNQDWLKAVGDWMKTRDYFQRTAQYQATQSGFKTYGAYLKAFQAKQKSVHKNGAIAWLLNALPLNAFTHGSDPLSVTSNLVTEPLANPSFSASYPLHALSRGGSNAFRVVNGTVMEGKAYMAAGVDLTSYAESTYLSGKPMTMDEVKKRLHKEIVEKKPTWLRALAPQLADEADKSQAGRTIEQILNVVGDTVLLRKPAFTGERVAAGAVDAAKNSTYIARTGRFSFAHLQNGDVAKAASVLEGGEGAEKLAAFSAQSIKRGWMTPEQFQDHIAELYSTGKTTLTIQKPLPETMMDVYRGGGQTSTEALDASKAVSSNNFGHVVFVTGNPGYASRYAELRGEGQNTLDMIHASGFGKVFNPEGLAEGVKPNVRMFKLDTRNMFPYLGKTAANEEVDTPALIKSVLRRLTPEEKEAAKTLETFKLADVKSPSTLYQYLSVLGQSMAHDALGAKLGREAKTADYGKDWTYGADFANEVLQRAGFKGILNGNEFAVFDPEKALRPRFEKPIQVTVNGPLLDSLRTPHLPTPSGVTLDVKQQVRNVVDSFDSGARQKGRVGTLAADFTSFIRQEFSHAVPQGARALYDPRFPERVHDWVLKHFNDADLANSYENAFVKARATGNTARGEKLMAQLQRKYYAKYQVGPGSVIEDDPFSPMLESEAGSRLFFPTGNVKNITNPLEAAEVTAQRVNRSLNRLGGVLRRILIISPSLAWKHAIGDTLRRIVGGDTILDPGARGALKEIGKLVDGDPQLARRWGTFLDRVTNGEAYYLAAPSEKSVTFATGDYLKSKPYMRAAGGYLRVMLDDKAYNAFLESTPDDLTPLIQLIGTNRVYRRLWAAKQKEAAITKYGRKTWDDKVRIVDFHQGIMQGRKQMMEVAFPVQDYAAQIYNRYRRVQEAANAQDTSLQEARDALTQARGAHADEALGEWVASHGIDFQVEKGLVSGTFSYDTVTSKVVQKIMTANKFNRNGMAKNVAARQYDALVGAGWDKKDALQTAMSVAEKQTVYHMLDFANRLQVEQDLRWLSFFATKHRLYWKWVTSTFVRNPAAAAVVGDLRDHLDQKGNLNFKLFGHHITVPAARLVWVNSKEYPEESALAGALVNTLKNGFSVQAFANSLAGSLGSGVTRDAVPAMMMVRAARMDLGNLPATYTNAVSGMDATNQRYFNRSVNHFQMDFFAAHGHYAPESEAVKYALWHLAGQNLWRGNLPLPAYFSDTPTVNQKELDSFMSITDPQKRSKYLDDHPDLAAQFGVSQNPNDYTHYRRYWSQYTQALDQYHAARDEIYQKALKQGFYTAEMDNQRRAVSAAFEKTFTQLKADDLARTPVARRREVNGELVGLWGQQVSADPLADPAMTLQKLFPNINKGQLTKGLPSELIKQARQELNLLNDPQWVAKTFTDPADARTRKRDLLQFIQDFQPFAHDNLGQLQEKYVQQYVNTYWKQVEKFNAQIATYGRGKKDVAYAQLRSWKDQHDQPVTIDGVKFPPPVVMAWATLPPDLRKQRLAALATGSWTNLADYEKTLLGVKTPEFTSYGYEKLLEARKQYAHDNPGHSLKQNQVEAIVDQIDKSIPGFKKDYNFGRQPKIDIFEQTNPYKDMPAHVKQWWDSIVSSNAHALAKAYNDPNRSSADRARLKVIWEDAVEKQILPALNSDPQVKKWLAPYMTANPDFLNTIIQRG